MAAIVDAINNATNDVHVRMAMLMGSYLEGGWGPTFGIGDGGTSFGPFQIHLPAHPGVTSAQANDPKWATMYMLPSYQAGVAKVPPQLWNSNPAYASALAAYYAERPSVMYPEKRYSAGWSAVQGALSGKIIPNPFDGGTSGNTGGSTPNATRAGLPWDWSGVENWLTDMSNVVLNYVVYSAAILFGGILVAAGLYLMFREGFNAGNVTNKVVTAVRVVSPVPRRKGRA